ncbi:MAG TPA: GNAT family N-acetyltransferase [Chitinophagaceae bacterium]|jgi:putative acetyltransferase|nr:GNAT family N-acetyltransferase [Chitinophagaceae bacterium]
MYHISKTNSADPDFVVLVQQLDADLAARDGDEHAFYHQFNSIQQLNHVVVLYDNNTPVACGAFKELEADTVEVKRMYTLPAHRSKGHASRILHALEQWAKEKKYSIAVLETGRRQPEAIELYKKNGYTIIPNYGQYTGIENSVCFQKMLSA